MKRTLSLLFVLLFLTAFPLSIAAETVDKSELEQMLNEVFDPTLYTEESYQTYQKAVNEALSVYENDYATEENIELARTTLMNARSGLTLLLNRDSLLNYISGIEEYLYGTTYQLTEETITILENAKDEFLTLYKKELLTSTQLSEAKNTFEQIKKTVEGSHKIKEFSSKNAKDDVIVPEKVINSSQGLGKVTAVRLTIVGIGIGLILLGTLAAIFYFKPPKFLQ